MIALREKNEKPEDISLETAEEDLDFSPEYYHKYETAIEMNKTLLKEQETFIQKLQEQAEFDRKKADNKIAQLEGTIEEQQSEQNRLRNQISNQQSEMDAQKAMILELQQKEREREKKRQLRINWIKLVVKNIAYILGLLVIAFGTYYVCKRKGWSFGTAISIVIGLGGLIPIAMGIVKNDYKNLISSVKKEME